MGSEVGRIAHSPATDPPGSSAPLLASLPGIAYRCRNVPDRTMEFLSEGCDTLTGHPAAAILLDAVWRFSHLVLPEDRVPMWDAIQAALAERRPYQLVYRLRTAQGEVRWVWDQGRGVFDGEGNASALEGFLTDITERSRTREALQESERRYQELAALLPEVVFEIDSQGILCFVNQQAFAVFRYPPEEIAQGFNIFAMVAPEDRARVRANIERGLRGEKLDNSEYLLFRKDGTTFPALVYSAPILRDGRPVGLRGFLVDISDRKRLEEELRQSEWRKTILNQIASIFLTVPDEEMYGEVLAVVQRALESPFGIFGFLAENGDLVIPSLTREAWSVCQVPGKSVIFPVATWGESLWGQAVREKRVFLSSGPFRTPAGHVPIAHFLTVPIVFGDVTIGLISVANKAGGYTGEDRALLEGIAHAISPILNARLQRDRQERERSQAEAALTLRTQQLTAVREVSTELTRELDLTRLLRLIVEQAVHLMQATSGTCFLWEEGSRTLLPQVCIGPDGWQGQPPHALQSGLAQQVALRREGTATMDPSTEPCGDPQAGGQRRIGAVIGEPLLYRERLIGVVTLDCECSREAFTPEERDLLRVFATQAAIAIENARLFQQEQGRRKELEATRAVTEEIARELDLTTLLHLIYVRAVDLVGGDAGAIYLWDEETQVLIPKGWHGLGAWMTDLRIRLGEGVTGTVAARRQGMIIPDFRVSAYTTPLWLERSRHVAVLAEPLQSHGQLAGVIAITRNDPARPFTEADQRLLRLFATQAAIAIENARLFQEQRRAYAQLQAAQEEMVRTEKLRALGQMAAGVAHDLNNMLAAILGQAELLQLRVKLPEVQEALQVLYTAASDGAQVVRRLQEFGRQQPTSPLQPCDLAPVVHEALELTRPRWQDEAQRQGRAIQVSTVLERLPRILGHPAELREVLTNLILNAVDAMPTGGVLVLVGHPSAEPPGVCLTVTDSGVGMSEEVRRHIFDPFYTTKGLRGTGLGLAVVYGIMERHGGHIDVASTPGRGTTFTLRFQTAPSEPSLASGDGPSHASRSRRILVIDDEAPVRTTLASLLRTVGHEVLEAETGGAGLANLAARAVDLVITDLGMPEMTGWEVARRVKAAHPHLPVILLTGWGQQLTGTAPGQGCVDRLLAKPVRLEELQSTIAELTTQGERQS